MLRLAFATLLTLMLVSCSEVPPVPGVGGSGGSGTGGNESNAGSGGTAGSGASGGDGGVQGCALTPVDELTEDDEVFEEATRIAFGALCSGGECREGGEDLVDAWSVTTCGGSHTILLTWMNDGTDDLDLAVLSGDALIEDSRTRTPIGTMEQIDVDLQRDETVTVEVQAVQTNGLKRQYRLRVLQPDAD